MSMVLRSSKSCIPHTINVLIVFIEAVRLRCYHFTDRNQRYSEIELKHINKCES